MVPAALLCAVLLVLVAGACGQTAPEQIHLSYTQTGTMTVTWVTQNATTASFRYSRSQSMSAAVTVPAETKTFKGPCIVSTLFHLIDTTTYYPTQAVHTTQL